MSTILLNFWSLQFQSKTRNFKGFKLRPPEGDRERTAAVKTSWHNLIKMIFHSPARFLPHLLSSPLPTCLCREAPPLSGGNKGGALRLSPLSSSPWFWGKPGSCSWWTRQILKLAKNQFQAFMSWRPRGWSLITDRDLIKCILQFGTTVHDSEEGRGQQSEGWGVNLRQKRN